MNTKFGVIGSNIKVAFQMEGKVPVLTKVDISQSLDKIKEEVFEKMGLPENEDFSLQISEESDSIHHGMLVTEETKHFIKVGAIIYIIKNPFNTLTYLANLFKERKDNKIYIQLIDHCTKFIKDHSFAESFIENDYFNDVYKETFKNKQINDPILIKSLKVLSTVISHKLLDNNKIPSDFISNCKIYFLDENASLPLLTEIYFTFHNLLYTSGSYYNEITGFVPPDIFKAHFYKKDFDLQISILAFITSIFIKTSSQNRIILRNIIFKSDFHNYIYDMVTNSKIENLSLDYKRYIMMLEYIYLYPIYITSITTSISVDNQDILDKFSKLYYSIYPEEEKLGIKPNYNRIGSKNKENPLEVFAVYPGSVALDCFFYFAEKKKDAFSKYIRNNIGVSSDQSEQNSSFSIFSVCIWIVKELLEYYHLYDQLHFDFSLVTYHPVIFSTINSFYELFCSLLIVFNRNWIEMSAQSNDLMKALLVLKEQLKLAFNTIPKNLIDFENQLEKFNYNNLLDMVSNDRSSGHILESKSTSVKWMKEYLKPIIIESLIHQRYSFMKNGTVFSKPKSKKGYIFCKLNPTHSAINYAECDDALPISDLPKKIDISAIEQIITKSDPNNPSGATTKDTFKATKKVPGTQQQTSILITTKDHEHTLELIAKNNSDYDFWVEGLNALIGKQTITPRINEEMSELLDLSVRISMIELDGVNIPEEPPRIPPLPSNFNFYYKDF